MTVWSPPAVAQFARDAGFRKGPLVTVTAIGLAASGGDDAYLQEGLFLQSDWLVGMFGIPLSDENRRLDSELFDPRRNAVAARTFYLERDKSFMWSQSFTTGWYRRYLVAAEAAAKQPAADVTTADARTAELGQAARAGLRALDNRARNLGSVPRTVGSVSWR